jgi:hypothetical protein
VRTPNIEIVGVVEDARVVSVRDAAEPAAFFPMAQRPLSARSLEVRVMGDPLRAVANVRAALREAAPELTIERIETIEQRIGTSLSQERLILFLTSGFGGLAMGLVGLGLFGVLSYAVARRTPELGIRMALGCACSAVPVLRASRVDPILALKQE